MSGDQVLLLALFLLVLWAILRFGLVLSNQKDWISRLEGKVDDRGHVYARELRALVDKQRNFQDYLHSLERILDDHFRTAKDRFCRLEDAKDHLYALVEEPEEPELVLDSERFYAVQDRLRAVGRLLEKTNDEDGSYLLDQVRHLITVSGRYAAEAEAAEAAAPEEGRREERCLDGQCNPTDCDRKQCPHRTQELTVTPFAGVLHQFDGGKLEDTVLLQQPLPEVGVDLADRTYWSTEPAKQDTQSPTKGKQ